jgi:hypothetical protein
MMIWRPSHFDDSPHPSVYDGLTGWASHARQRSLVAIAVAGAGAWAAVLGVDWRHGPMAACLLTASAVAAWGLLEQRATSPHSGLITAAELVLVILGTVTAVVSGFALLFWVMGPAPVL